MVARLLCKTPGQRPNIVKVGRLVAPLLLAHMQKQAAHTRALAERLQRESAMRSAEASAFAMQRKAWDRAAFGHRPGPACAPPFPFSPLPLQLAHLRIPPATPQPEERRLARRASLPVLNGPAFRDERERGSAQLPAAEAGARSPTPTPTPRTHGPGLAPHTPPQRRPDSDDSPETRPGQPSAQRPPRLALPDTAADPSAGRRPSPLDRAGADADALPPDPRALAGSAHASPSLAHAGSRLPPHPPASRRLSPVPAAGPQYSAAWGSPAAARVLSERLRPVPDPCAALLRQVCGTADV